MKNKEQMEFIDSEIKAIRDKQKEIAKGLKTKDIYKTSNIVSLLRSRNEYLRELKEQRKH